MKNLTFGACMHNSWISTFKFIVLVPWVVAGFIVVMIACTWLSGLIPWKSEAITFPLVVSLLLGLPVVLIAYPWLYFKACRFVILDERTHPLVPPGDARPGRAVAIYVACGAAMTALPMLFSGLVVSGAFAFDAPVRRWVCAIAFIAAALFVSRVILVFVGASLGEGLDFRAAWRNSRGHALVITASLFINALPLAALLSYFSLIGGMQDVLTGSVSSSTLIALLVTLLVLVQSACTVSWLYLRCTIQLPDGERARSTMRPDRKTLTEQH
jgi:hypothetical protein